MKNRRETGKLLLESTTEIEARDTINKTPLYVAAQNNSTETAKLLLEHSAEIEARDANNRTSLQNAAWHNRTNVAKLLLEGSAEIEARDADNGTSCNYDARFIRTTPFINLQGMTKYKLFLQLNELSCLWNIFLSI